MKFLSKKIKFNSAFTLLEVLVAISIFTVSILAIMSVLASGISGTSYTKSKIIATYLAQEGIEQVRNLRDSYVIANPTGQAGWAQFKSRVYTGHLCEVGYGGCYFDDQVTNFVITQCIVTGVTATGCPQLKYNTNTGKYDYDPSGIDSGFSRKIRVNTDPSNLQPNEVKVDSIVSWMQGSTLKSVMFSESLFNWSE